MVVLITGPTGIDVLIEPDGGQLVVEVAAKAASELGVSGTPWALARQNGEIIDALATVAASGIDCEPVLILVDPTAPDAVTSPASPTMAALTAIGSRGPAQSTVVIERVDPTPTRPRPTPQPNVVELSAARRRPLIGFVASVVAAVMVGLIAGLLFAAHNSTGNSATASATQPIETVPLTTTVPPQIVLSGTGAALTGPVRNLSAGATALPGQILTAPTPATGTAVDWRWQRCPLGPETCQDIPGATGDIYTSPPTSAPLRIRVLVVTELTAGGPRVTWASDPFQALPAPPTTTTATPTTTTIPLS